MTDFFSAWSPHRLLYATFGLMLLLVLIFDLGIFQKKQHIFNFK